MAIENRLRLVPLVDITFPADRQREQIDPKGLLPLAASIATHGLLQTIGIKEEDSSLVFGGRRYHAALICSSIHNETEHPLLDNFTAEDLLPLRELLRANPLYDGWTKLPCRLVRGLTDVSASAMEFLENACREDISWQERAKACLAIHQQFLAEKRAAGITWTDTNTANNLGISRFTIQHLMTPLRAVAAIQEPTIKAAAERVIKEAPSPRSAANSIAAIAERHGVSTNPVQRLALKVTTPPKAPAPTETKPTAPTVTPAVPSLSLGEQSIICANFHEWAASYKGQPFNFLHCDFPYGVEFNESAGQNTSAATRQVGEYDDGEPVYWALLDTLLVERTRLLEPSAHLMFWLSIGDSKLHNAPMIDLTKQRIAAAWPDARISSVYLIWHMTDNSGLMPDPKRAPRRTYEIALHVTLGDRPLAKGKAASFAYPRNSDTKLHRSQKHRPVLEHFLEMFCDSSTRMLDPTCGSGNSVIVAHLLGAKHVLGLELDPKMRSVAVDNFNKSANQ